MLIVCSLIPIRGVSVNNVNHVITKNMAAPCVQDGPSLSDSDLASLAKEHFSTLRGFNINECIFDDQCCLVLTHQRLYNHPPVGLTSRVKILVKGEEYVVHIL